MDKIDENYIQYRIQDSRKNWYIYLHYVDNKNDMGIIEGNHEKEAYVKIFDKFPISMTATLVREHRNNSIIKKKMEDSNVMNLLQRYMNEMCKKMIDETYIIDNEILNELSGALSALLFYENKGMLLVT